MKIAIMGGWNTASGASLHCELIGREFVKMKHELKVFTFYQHAYHGTHITGLDEPYVNRCYTHSRFNPISMEAKPFITNDYQLFIAEDIGMLPKDHLAKIFNTHIRKKAKTVQVYHDNQLSDDPAFYQLEWDAIVAFDQRFKDILTRAYPEDKIHIIPYPCTNWQSGNHAHFREKLHLPSDKKIIFSFGDNSNRILNVVEGINALAGRYPILLLILSRDPITIQHYTNLKKKMKFDIEIREEAPSLNRVNKYLHVADAMLYYRNQVLGIVVASTILQCIGAGCPIISNDTRYTELLDDEIFKFSNHGEMMDALVDVFDKTKRYRNTMKSAKDYVNKNSARATAEKFLKLYEQIK